MFVAIGFGVKHAGEQLTSLGDEVATRLNLHIDPIGAGQRQHGIGNIFDRELWLIRLIGYAEAATHIHMRQISPKTATFCDKIEQHLHGLGIGGWFE